MSGVVVLYNDDASVVGGDAKDAIAVTDVRVVAEQVAEAVAGLGPVALATTGRGDPEELARELRRLEPDCVFNLAEAARGVAALECCVAGVLDLLGLPYTGNTAPTLALCLDKPRTKLVLRGAGVPVPRGVVLRDAARDPIAGLAYPVIVKPACMDASHGIDETSVVADEPAARRKAAELIRRFGAPALVEDYVDGDDALVGVFQPGVDAAPIVLPLGKIDFQTPPGVPRVSTFASKWEEDSETFQNTPGVYPASFGADVDDAVRAAALAAFAAVDARDYVRVDIRVDPRGGVHVLEVNPNPCLTREVGFARAAGLAGWSYEALVRRLVQNAVERGPLSALPLPR